MERKITAVFTLEAGQDSDFNLFELLSRCIFEADSDALEILQKKIERIDPVEATEETPAKA